MASAAILTFGQFAILDDTKNGSTNFIGFSRPTGGKTQFSLKIANAYITLPCATALACHIARKLKELNNQQNLYTYQAINVITIQKINDCMQSNCVYVELII